MESGTEKEREREREKEMMKEREERGTEPDERSSRYYSVFGSNVVCFKKEASIPGYVI